MNRSAAYLSGWFLGAGIATSIPAAELVPDAVRLVVAVVLGLIGFAIWAVNR